jgi:hypothetical protein
MPLTSLGFCRLQPLKLRMLTRIDTLCAEPGFLDGKTAGFLDEIGLVVEQFFLATEAPDDDQILMMDVRMPSGTPGHWPGGGRLGGSEKPGDNQTLAHVISIPCWRWFGDGCAQTA